MNTQTRTPKGTTQTPPPGDHRKQLEATRLVRTHALGAAGLGLIPLPLVDLFLVMGLQLRMLKKVGELYGVPFKGKQRGYELLSAAGGTAFSFLMFPFLLSLIKFIPFLGTGAGLLAMPPLAGATTYSVGKLFIQRLEAGEAAALPTSV